MPTAALDAHVVLFKPTDLRLHDHQPLIAAHRAAAVEGGIVIHLCVLDAFFFGPSAPPSREAKLPRLDRKRAAFLQQSIEALQQSIAGHGHELLVYLGRTVDALSAIAAMVRAQSPPSTVAAVYAHGPELTSEEQHIERSIAAQYTLKLYWGWTLTHIDDLPVSMARGKSCPDRFKPFLEAVQRGKGPARYRPAAPQPAWTARAMPRQLQCAIVGSELAANGSWGLPAVGALLRNGGGPTLAYVPPVQPGGEAAALAALHSFIWQDDRLRRYVGSSDSMSPGVDNALNATTRLSAYLAHGCLSARRLYDEVRNYERRRVRNRSTYWVYHELIMRDFLAFSCIKWGTRLFSAAGPLDASSHRWRDAGESETRQLFERWTSGTTGYPFVDAGMRQLAAVGTMPHLLRQVCAAFLVRDLRVPWRWGAEWFELHLLDHTPDANYGNWGYRILPVQQLQPLATKHLTSLEILSWPVVHDPHLEYILKWVPELRRVAEQSGPQAAREPWRLAADYQRDTRIRVAPRRDSPLWVMSVNRGNWPEYQQMMSGVGYTLRFVPESSRCISSESCPYPPPCVPPVELEILLDRIPVDHSWGTSTRSSVPPLKLASPPPPPSPALPQPPLHIPQTPSSVDAMKSPLPPPVTLSAPMAPSSTARPRTGCHVYWFRKALRVHDNPSLLAARDAAVAAAVPLLAVFVLDPWFVSSGRVGSRRLRFLLDCLQDLDASLQQNVGIPLLVLRGTPSTALPSLWSKHRATTCTWEMDSEVYAKVRDSEVEQIAAQRSIETVVISGHTLHSLEALLERCPGRTPPTKYNDFLLLLEAMDAPPAPLPAPAKLPAALTVMTTLGPEELSEMSVPATMKEMGFHGEMPTDPAGHEPLRGGETNALTRLTNVVEARATWVQSFSKPSTNPLLWSPGSTTMLSPYLKFGCLSVRRMHSALDEACRGHHGRCTTPPQSLHGQLYWREFFYLLSHATPNFGRAAGNPLCLQVQWREPALDPAAAKALKLWEEGCTGVPLVDAAMRQVQPRQ